MARRCHSVGQQWVRGAALRALVAAPLVPHAGGSWDHPKGWREEKVAGSGSWRHLVCFVFREAGAALGSLESPVPPFHHTGQSSCAPPVQPVWCWQSPVWHSHDIRRAGATRGASSCCHWQSHSVCQCRVQHQGTSRGSCASVWPCPGTSSVSPVVNTDWRHCREFERCWWPCV